MNCEDKKYDSPTSDVKVDAVHHSDVGRLARRGAAWSVFQIVVRNVLTLGTTAVLTRLVSPGDYGLVGMVATLTAFLLVFSDLGLSWATVQRRELTEFQVSNLFWLNTFAGLGLWGVSVLFAPRIASFYGRHELELVTIIMGSTFLLGGLSAQPMALLSRKLDFRTSTGIELAALLASSAAGVLLAIYSFGYWALVLQSVTQQLVKCTLAVFFAGPKIKRPNWDSGTSSLITFGGLLAINNLFIYLARNLDNIFIGKVWGAVELGYYNRAYFLMLLPSSLATGAFANLMVPSLAAFQNDSTRLAMAYRRVVRIIALVGCPMALGLALTADETIQLVYGSIWTPVVPILIWLSMAGITQPIYNTTGWLFTVSGRPGIYLLLTGANAILLALSFYLTVYHGVIYVAIGYGVVMGLIIFMPAMYLAHRVAGIAVLDTYKILIPTVISLSVMALGVYLAGSFCRLLSVSVYASFFIKVIVGLLIYIIASFREIKKILNEEFSGIIISRSIDRFLRA